MDIIDDRDRILKSIASGKTAVQKRAWDDGTPIDEKDIPYLERLIKASEEMLSWNEPFSFQEWNDYADRMANA